MFNYYFNIQIKISILYNSDSALEDGADVGLDLSKI